MRQIGVWIRLEATFQVVLSSDYPVYSGYAGGDRHNDPYLFVPLLAVFADFLKAAAVGAPLLPGALILSPLPDLILALLAWMFA